MFLTIENRNDKETFMKKWICLIFTFIFCASLLVSCKNNDMEISSDETTQPVETTEARPYPQPRDTEPIKKESPELQEKIDRNQKHSHGVPSKVIIECGGKRDVPFLLPMGGTLYNTIVDGYAIAVYTNEKLLEDSVYFPTYTITGQEDFSVFCNDELQNDGGISEISVHFLEPSTDYMTEHVGTKKNYASIAELYQSLEKGTYYAYVSVSCYGDDIMLRDEKMGVERMSYHAYFILELV